MKKILIFLFLTFSLFAQQVDKKNAVQPNEQDMALSFSDKTAGQEGGTTEKVDKAPSNIGFKEILGLIFSFIVIIIIIVIAFKFLKFLIKPKELNSGFIKTITSEILFENRYVHIVKVGNNFYFLGSASDSVNLLEKIVDKELIDELNLYESKNPQFTETFMDKISSSFAGSKKMLSMNDRLKMFKDKTKKYKDKLKKM